MIIDSKEAKSDGPFRAYSASQAVALALDEINVGSFVDVEAFKDAVGRDIPRSRLDVYVNKASGDRKFSVRKQEGMVARIYRVA